MQHRQNMEIYGSIKEWKTPQDDMLSAPGVTRPERIEIPLDYLLQIFLSITFTINLLFIKLKIRLFFFSSSPSAIATSTGDLPSENILKAWPSADQ
jgi:hypothetical protein